VSKTWVDVLGTRRCRPEVDVFVFCCLSSGNAIRVFYLGLQCASSLPVFCCVYTLRFQLDINFLCILSYLRVCVCVCVCTSAGKSCYRWNYWAGWGFSLLLVEGFGTSAFWRNKGMFCWDIFSTLIKFYDAMFWEINTLFCAVRETLLWPTKIYCQGSYCTTVRDLLYCCPAVM
jgi:hypothetical protein